MPDRMCRACHHRPADLGLEYCWSCRARGADCADPEHVTLNTLGGDEMPEETKAEKPGRPGLAGKLVELLEAAEGRVVPLGAITEALYGEPWEKGSVVARRLHQVVYAATHKLGQTIVCEKGAGCRIARRPVGVVDIQEAEEAFRPRVAPTLGEIADALDPPSCPVVQLRRRRTPATIAPELAPVESPEAGTMAVRDRLDLAEAFAKAGTLLAETCASLEARECGLAAQRICKDVAKRLGIENDEIGKETA